MDESPHESVVLQDASEIRAINKDTIHNICSGQVILSLATAVKELVENALDAGAKLIEIKLREQGKEYVEVTDNGCGIQDADLKALTAKYHTSKLSEMSDLESISTFGFRGEALSSLCALSDMAITTRHTSAQHGTRVELDHYGVIAKKSPCARSVGTTVRLSNLFSTLIVRKKMFEKNIKREYTQMLHILQAYCLASTECRINCVNETAKGVRNIVLSTTGAKNVLENIGALFGSKQVEQLVVMRANLSEEQTVGDASANEGSEPDPVEEKFDDTQLARFKYDGWISSCRHGSGRSSCDRQFFFINSRPCEPKQIVKLVNEIYRNYNNQQYPFVYLNVSIKQSEVDVNVTPDKRQIFVANEKILLYALKKALTDTFAAIAPTFEMHNSRSASVDIIDENGERKRPTFMDLFKNMNAPTSGSEARRLAKRKSSNDLLRVDKLKRNDDCNETRLHSARDIDNSNATGVRLERAVSETEVENIFKFVKKDKFKVGRSKVLAFTETDIQRAMHAEESARKLSATNERRRVDRLRFKVRIGRDAMVAAEKELSTELSKNSFSKMRIVGQFNCGFIVAALNDDDLFIIDQHATDEKYNFEMLQQFTTVHSQKLVVPESMSLTALNEIVLMDNLKTFEMNGFHFAINLDAPPTKRVQLTAKPISKNWVFGRDDIDEMLFMLQESSGMCRPTRVRAMFASRACRKSVMIGTTLTKTAMKSLIHHMAEIDHPWNCPHGRPTIRHLINLSMLTTVPPAVE